VAGSLPPHAVARAGAAAGLVGMGCWVVAVAVDPAGRRLADGDAAVAAMFRSAGARTDLAALLGAIGAVLLVGLLVALTVLVSVDRPGGMGLRVGLAGGVVTQTLVCAGVAFGVVAAHAARSGVGAVESASPTGRCGRRSRSRPCRPC
jgi:hypothetical protein